MRFPPNLKYVLLFLLALALIMAGVVYLPSLIPNIGKIMVAICCVGMIVLIFFTFLKPMMGLLYARADGLFAVYIDQSQLGFHVFAYHINSGGEYSSSSTRDIQHYYITFDKGRIFYKTVYSHSMKPVTGRSGWEGFDSFESSVLPSKGLAVTINKLSKKAGLLLKLGQRIENVGDHNFSFETGGLRIDAKKYETAADEGIRVTCTEQVTSTVRWKLKI